MEKIKEYFKRDMLARELDMELIELSAGRAVAKMTLAEKHYNSLRMTHGGTLFTLADFTFAAASNSYGQIAVAVNASISFFRPTHSGTLTAVAEETHTSRSLGHYTVRITDQEGQLVAQFQGTAFRKNQPLPLEQE